MWIDKILVKLLGKTGIYHQWFQSPRHTIKFSFIWRIGFRKYLSLFRFVTFATIVCLGSIFKGTSQYNSVHEEIQDQLIKYEKYDDGSYGQETRGCNNPGFKSEQWCQTDCWTGQRLILPEAVFDPGCDKYNDKQLVLYVYSDTYNFQTRQEVRDLFNYYYDSSETGLIFLVALPRVTNSNDEELLHREMSSFRDILRLNFTDTYNNISYKGLGFFKWIKKCGSDVKYIAKADDNEQKTFGRLFVAYKFLRQLDPDFKSQIIYCLSGLLNVDVHGRKGRREHEVDKFEFSGDYWPKYCRGDLGTFIPTNIIDNLLAAAQDTSIMRIEDAYFTGLLRVRACLQIYFIDLFWVAWLRQVFDFARMLGIV